MNHRPAVMFGAPRIGRDEIREVVATLRGGWIGTGPRTAEFESAFRTYLGARHAVATGSGTAALHLALVAAGIRPGDEVVTTPLTFAATANAILAAGAVPRFADVGLETQNIDPERAARAVTKRTRALLPVHLAGRPCEMPALLALARRRHLVLVEDASHAIEALVRGRHAGTLGDFGCFSFTHNKNITAGEGGAVVTRSAGSARLIRMVAGQGMTANAWQRSRRGGSSGYRIVAPGFKYGMTDLNAAIGLHQLKRIDRWWRRRRAVWTYYTERLRGLPVWLPSSGVPGGRHALHLFTVHLDLARLNAGRDRIRAELAARGIGTGVHYVSLHLHPYYRSRFGLRPDDFPNARRISERTLSLPLSPHLTGGEVERVAGTFRTVLERHARPGR
ncbi:MAG: DegT/DnrJ/EryC1/StrS family aminotransferase [Candidatus Coatesbacteria bacterium]